MVMSVNVVIGGGVNVKHINLFSNKTFNVLNPGAYGGLFYLSINK